MQREAPHQLVARGKEGKLSISGVIERRFQRRTIFILRRKKFGIRRQAVVTLHLP